MKMGNLYESVNYQTLEKYLNEIFYMSTYN